MPVVSQSRFSYADTVARLQAAIVEHGNTVFATFDQAAAAQSVGLTLRPTTLIVFGNPKAGTALMEAEPLVALDLPLKLAIWETEAVVYVAYTPAADIAARYTIVGKDMVLAAIEAALELLVKSVA